MKNTVKILSVLSIVCVLVITGICLKPTLAEKPSNRLQEILERGYIEVVTEPYFAPNEFIDPNKAEGENIVGSDILLAERIAERLGVELKLVPLDFTAVLASITEGKYDLAISALAWTPVRAESMEMSNGYYFGQSGNYTVMCRKGEEDKFTCMEDLNGKTIVCQAGSLQQQLIEDAIKTYNLDLELTYVSATTDGYMMVDYGKADAAVCASTNAQLYADANGNLAVRGDYIEFTVSDDYLGTRIGGPKGETELMEAVNEIIEEILESGEYVEWYNEYSDYAKTLGL